MGSEAKSHFCDFLYCRRKELMASVRKPREKRCASAFHPSKTRKTRMHSGRRSIFRVKRATPCQADPVAGARIVATATAWVHRGSVQLANTTILQLFVVSWKMSRSKRVSQQDLPVLNCVERLVFAIRKRLIPLFELALARPLILVCFFHVFRASRP